MTKRACRACGADYEYPARGRVATRVHCEDCATLDPSVRRVVEKLAQRINRLSAELREVKSKGPS